MSSKKNTDSLKRRNKSGRGRGRGQWVTQKEPPVTPVGSPSQLSPEQVPYKEQQGFGGPSTQTPRYSAHRHSQDFSPNFSRSDQFVSAKQSPSGTGPTAGGTPVSEKMDINATALGMTGQKSLEEIKENAHRHSQDFSPNFSRSDQFVSAKQSPTGVGQTSGGTPVSEKMDINATALGMTGQKSLEEIKENAHRHSQDFSPNFSRSDQLVSAKQSPTGVGQTSGGTPVSEKMDINATASGMTGQKSLEEIKENAHRHSQDFSPNFSRSDQFVSAKQSPTGVGQTSGGTPVSEKMDINATASGMTGQKSLEEIKENAHRHSQDFSPNFSRSDQFVSAKQSPTGVGQTSGGTPVSEKMDINATASGMTGQKSLEEIKENMQRRSQDFSNMNISRSSQLVSTTHSPVLGFVVVPPVSDKMNPDATSQKEIKRNVEEQMYADAKDVILPQNSKAVEAASVTSTASGKFGDICTQSSTVVDREDIQYGVNAEQDLFLDCENSENKFETTGVANSGRFQTNPRSFQKSSELVDSSRNMKMNTEFDKALEEKISVILIKKSNEIKSAAQTTQKVTKEMNQSATFKQYYSAMTNVIGEKNRSEENYQTKTDKKPEYTNAKLYTDKTVKYTKGEDLKDFKGEHFKDFKGEHFKESKGGNNKDTKGYKATTIKEDVLNNYKRDISDSKRDSNKEEKRGADETKGQTIQESKENAVKETKEGNVKETKRVVMKESNGNAAKETKDYIIQAKTGDTVKGNKVVASNAANEKEDTINVLKEEAVNETKEDNSKEVPRATVVGKYEDTTKEPKETVKKTKGNVNETNRDVIKEANRDNLEGTKEVMQTNISPIKDTTKATKKDSVKEIGADTINNANEYTLRESKADARNIKGGSAKSTEGCLKRDYIKDSEDKVQLPLAINQSAIRKSKDIEDKQAPYEMLIKGIQAKAKREYFEIASGGEELAMPAEYAPKSSAKSLVLKLIHMLSMEHSQTNVEAILTLTDLLKIVKND